MFDLEKNKQYGILLSGGLDSAILLYLLIKQDPNIRIQPFTIPKHDGSALYVNPIIAHLNSKFEVSIPETIYVGDPNAHHTEQSSIAINEIFIYHDIDHLFMGVTPNPTELNHLDGAPKRKLIPPVKKLVYPFANMLKDKLVQIMFDEGQEDLANITHSCTERTEGRCNICWQCQERAWAFNQLNKVDTGTL